MTDKADLAAARTAASLPAIFRGTICHTVANPFQEAEPACLEALSTAAWSSMQAGASAPSGRLPRYPAATAKPGLST